MRKIVVLCVMLCICVVSKAQMFTNIRATQTLAVRAIAQTDDGCVWFCAGKTLYCFDGKKIRPLDSDAFDGMGAIGCLKVNRDGNLMMGCERGMIIYNIRKGLFELHEKYRGENVRTICLEGEDEWIGTSGGFYHNGCVVDSLSDVVSMIKNGDKILISCMDALREYDVKIGKMERMDMPFGGFITCFEKDAKGKVIAGSVHDILDYDFAKNKLTPLHDGFPVVKCMILMRDLWVRMKSRDLPADLSSEWSVRVLPSCLCLCFISCNRSE